MNDRLYRSRDDRMLAGVAGGLADYWDADPSLIRIIWVLLAIFTGGLALVIYIVMAFVVPDEDTLAYPTASAATSAPPVTGAPAGPTAQGWAAAPAAGPSVSPSDRLAARRAARAARRTYRRQHGAGMGAALAGILLVLLGGFFLARQWLPQLDFDWFWPMILIALGVVIIAAAFGRTHEDRPGPQ
ncbi:MAG: PspC domain-containing protein [Candidatus Limnocylindrales bacterium]